MPKDEGKTIEEVVTGVTTKNARRRKAKKKPALEKAVGSGQIARDGRAAESAAARFQYILTQSDKEMREYLKTVFHPTKYGHGVPAATGGFELYTKTWRTFDSGVAVAGSNGVAVVGVGCDSWAEDGNAEGQPLASSKFLGYTNPGAACFASSNAAISYAGIGGATTDSFDPAQHTSSVMMKPMNAGELSASTRMRLVAVELSVKSVLAADTAKGEIALVSSVNPRGGIAGGTINTAKWNDLKQTPAEVLVRAVRNVAGWKSDQTFTIVAIPAEAQAFEMVERPANSLINTVGGTYGLVTLGMIARAMTPGDQIEYEVCYLWESEMAASNEATPNLQKLIPQPIEDIGYVAALARPYASSGRVPGVSDLPWVESLSHKQPQKVGALALTPTVPDVFRPSSHPLVVKPLMAEQKPTSFLGKVQDVAKGALHGIASSKILDKIPYVGGALNSLAGWLDGVFN